MTLGELKASGYKSKTIKQELRQHLITRIKAGEDRFPGIHGFDQTVLPELERAILSGHNILLLGLRGQAKTRIARMLVNLLDEYIPFIEGSDIHDDPLHPVSHFAREQIQQHGDKTRIGWLHRSQRYIEKLATPDVSIADLIGDVDPIKAATLKLPYSDPRVIHFGLIPRSHRSIFVINELPDLQARIQVSLFNILQESDLQIRGFTFRLPLDIQFIFTANPEDYTNRGSIITPLKDRIESQILTHYPEKIEIARKITDQEARIPKDQRESIRVPELLRNLIEKISFEARESEFIDEKSGVSARLSITALENLYATAERRMLINGHKNTVARISDLWGIIPSITGKIELVYEGEQEGPYAVALSLMEAAFKEEFLQFFPQPTENKDGVLQNYESLKLWFGNGNAVSIPVDSPDEEYQKALLSVPELKEMVKRYKVPEEDANVFMELILHGLSSYEVIQKDFVDFSLSFKDVLADMWREMEDDDNDF